MRITLTICYYVKQPGERMVDRVFYLQISLPISYACAQLHMLAGELGGCMGHAQLDNCVADCDRHIQQRSQEQVGQSAHPAPTK